jgi:DNA polymerase-4
MPFYPLIGPLLRGAWKKRRPLRLISVRFSSVEDGAQQLEMFGQVEEKRRRLAGILDKLNRGGKDSVVQHGHQLATAKGASGKSGKDSTVVTSRFRESAVMRRSLGNPDKQ